MTPKPINVLQSHVVDQIAAGEVVERPSHLVKELVENSIDAGAKEIEVEFDHGGRYVRVVDDGAGILPEDLPKALARHATSKIQAADEIWSIQSFGFRGEALASIAAVSRLELQSKPRLLNNSSSSGSAFKIESEFGRIGDVVESSGNNGTVIKISELFENVPARLKFMKSEMAEGAQIRNVLKAIAISHPTVGIRLRSRALSNGTAKTEFVFKHGDDFLSRCQTALGVKLHYTEGEFEGIEVQIAFSGPQDVTGNSKGLWFFVQDRWIQDRSLQAAVIESYRGLLMHGEYPVAVVKLKAPSGEVDVNIHPTKSAVKFRDPSRAFRAVSRTLRAALEKAPWLEGAGTEVSRGSAVASGAVATGTIGSGATLVPESPQTYSLKDFSRPYKSSVADPSPSAVSFEFSSPDFLKVQAREKTFPVADPSTKKSVGVWSRLDILGQASQTYIVCQEADKLVFVDQHAAHERVAYERLMKAWKAKGEAGKLETQSLLIPLLIDFEEDQLEALLRHQSDLRQIGLFVEQMGPRTMAVLELPVILKESVLAKALKDMAIAALDRGGSFVLEEKIGDIFATMACHSVVRAGQTLSREQMHELLLQMDEFPLSSFCPHGRPVSVEYPFSKLERDFGRTV
ncbi:MAG: DNA mismatch repair endonuclease MutL [Bdellovibrionales bacterium]|nr:DNA mismatch repair endonuclease MutL [Bdellovibrionales bacterium]